MTVMKATLIEHGCELFTVPYMVTEYKLAQHIALGRGKAMVHGDGELHCTMEPTGKEGTPTTLVCFKDGVWMSAQPIRRAV